MEICDDINCAVESDDDQTDSSLPYLIMDEADTDSVSADHMHTALSLVKSDVLPSNQEEVCSPNGSSIKTLPFTTQEDSFSPNDSINIEKTSSSNGVNSHEDVSTGSFDDSVNNNNILTSVTDTLAETIESSLKSGNSSSATPTKKSLPKLALGKPTASKRPRHDVNERRALLAKAVRDVQEEKISMRKASLRYNLAKSSLCDYVRKNNIALPNLRIKSAPVKKMETTATAAAAATVAARAPVNGAKLNNNTATKAKPSSPPEIVVPPTISQVSVAPTIVNQIQFCNGSNGELVQHYKLESAKKLSNKNSKNNKPRPIAPKFQRLESPWSCSTGLPTQVPISSWGVMSSSETKLKPLVIPISLAQEILNNGDKTVGVLDYTIPMAPLSSPEEDNSDETNDKLLKTIPQDQTLDFDREIHAQNAREMLSFINKSPTHFHAVKTIRSSLLDAGYKEISECEPWMFQTSSRVFYTRAMGSELVAMVIGSQYKPSSGFTVLGAQLDSPYLKLKPYSWWNQNGTVLVKTIASGSGRWSSWMNKYLGLAGRCFIKSNASVEQRLVHIDEPLIRINQDVNSNDVCGFLNATLCLQHTNQTSTPENSMNSRFPDALLGIISEELSVNAADIIDMELFLCDTESGALTGTHLEHVNSSRLDNLFNVFAVTEAFLGCNDSVWSENNVRVAYFFNSEGSASSFHDSALSRSEPRSHATCYEWLSRLRDTILSRTTAALHATDLSRCGPWGQAQMPDLQAATASRSCALWTMQTAVRSRDVLPHLELAGDGGYTPSDVSDDEESDMGRGQQQTVKLSGGLVIRLPTSNLASPVLREVASLADVPLQDYLTQDMCGRKPAINCVQVGAGVARLGSSRELVASCTVTQAIRLYRTFIENYSQIQASIKTSFD